MVPDFTGRHRYAFSFAIEQCALLLAWHHHPLYLVRRRRELSKAVALKQI